METYSVPPPEFATVPTPFIAVCGLQGNNARSRSASVDHIGETSGSNIDNNSGPSNKEAEQTLPSLETCRRHLLALLTRAEEIPGREGDRPQMHVVAVARESFFPPKKPHNKDFPANYVPDGCIRADWATKHRAVYPAVLAVFLELPDHLVEDFDHREMDQALVEEIIDKKKNLLERNIKLAVVIIMQPHQADDPASEERIILIRKQCGLDAKNSLFVLPIAEVDLADFVLNFERCMHEQAVAHYREEGKRIKKKKFRLYRNTQLQLLIRYDFKIGFYSECRRDWSTALKFYNSAYISLVELVTSGKYPHYQSLSRMLEAKTLADLFSQKILRILLQTECREALANFQSHLKTWDYMGPESLEFLHKAWLSRQYRVYGELVEHALKNGLVLVDSHPHPGYFYQMAANFSMERKAKYALFSKAFDDDNEKVDDNFIRYLPASLFLGVIPARLETHMLDNGSAPSPTFEAIENLARLHEKCTLSESSPLVIELLTKAYEQYKLHKSTRNTLHLASLIAEQYFELGKFDMALRFFERIAKTYRKESWNSILGSLEMWSLRTAWELGNREAEIEHSIELLSKNLNVDQNEKRTIMESLLLLLQGRPSRGPAVPDLTARQHLSFEMDQINSIFDIEVQFKTLSSFVKSPTLLQISIMSHAPLPIRLSQLKVPLSDQTLGYALVDSKGVAEEAGAAELSNAGLSAPQLVQVCGLPKVESTESWLPHGYKADLRLWPGKRKVFEFLCVPLESQDLKVVSIGCWIASCKWDIELFYKVSEAASSHRKKRHWYLPAKASAPANDLPYLTLEGLGEVSSIPINLRVPNIDIQLKHKPPAILDEYFAVPVLITNKEKEVIHAWIDAEPRTNVVNEPKVSVTINPKVPLKSRLVHVDFGKIEPGGSLTKRIYLHGSGAAGEKSLHVKIHYCLESELGHMQPIASMRRHSLSTQMLAESGAGNASDPALPVAAAMAASLAVGGGSGGGQMPRSLSSQHVTDPRCDSSSIDAGTSIVTEVGDRRFYASKEEVFAIQFIRGFESDLKFTPIDCTAPDPKNYLLQHPLEEYFAIATLKNISPWPVRIIRGELQLETPLKDRVTIMSARDYSDLDPSSNQALWLPNTAVYFLYKIAIQPNLANELAEEAAASKRIGSIVLQWRREEGGSEIGGPNDQAAKTEGQETEKTVQTQRKELLDLVSKTQFPVPLFEQSRDPVIVLPEIPAVGYLGEPLAITYRFVNNGPRVEELQVVIEPSESFVYSGYKQTTFRIKPHSSTHLTFNCLPVLPDRARLPRLRVIHRREERELLPSGLGGVVGASSGGVSTEDENAYFVFIKPQDIFFPPN